MRTFAAASLLLALLLLIACGEKPLEIVGNGSEVEGALPRVDLSTMEPAVADSIEGAVREVDEAGPETRLRRLIELAETYQAYELFAPASEVWRSALKEIAEMEEIEEIEKMEELQEAGSAREALARAHYLLALAQQRLGDPEAAVENLEASQRLARQDTPEGALVALRLAEAQLGAGQSAAVIELLEPWMEPWQSANSANAVLAFAHATLASAAVEERDFASAVESFEAALAIVPEVRSWSFQLARALRELAAEQEDPEAAAELQSRARALLLRADQLSAPPSLPDRWASEVAMRARGGSALLRQADAASLAGEGARAVELYRQATEVAPGRIEGWQSLAAELSQQERFEEALAALTTAAALDPDSLSLRSSRAAILARLAVEAAREGDVERALAKVRASVELSLAPGGALDTAIASHNEVAERELILATIQVLARRWREAAATLEAAHSRSPDNPAVAIALSRLLSTAPEPQLHDGARALELARTALDRDGSFEAARAVGLALARTGSLDQAQGWQSQLLDRARSQGLDAATIGEIEGELELFRSGRAKTAN